MDVYGMSSPDLLRIDDLLDFSNDEIFSSSSTVTSSAASSAASSENPFSFPSSTYTSPTLLTDFTHDLCVPVRFQISIYPNFDFDFEFLSSDFEFCRVTTQLISNGYRDSLTIHSPISQQIL
jgi:CCR4-NOT transcriptional regulation complex NOT5 subunit